MQKHCFRMVGSYYLSFGGNVMTVQKRIDTDKAKGALLISSRGRRERLACERDINAAAEGSAPHTSSKLQLLSPGLLKAADRRTRKTSAAQLKRVVQSVERYGVVIPVLVDANRVVINGHIVVEAAKALGLSTIPVVEVSHLNEAEVRALRITLNRLAETGEWDMPALAIELGELGDLAIDLSSLGFSMPELDIILLGDGDDTARRDKVDALPAPSSEIVSVLDDMWLLGEHRIICGDATMREPYERLLGDERVHAVFSDAPFNIPIEGVVSSRHKDFVQGSGEWSPAEFLSVLDRYLQRCREVTVPGAAIFACMDWRSADVLMAAGEAAGLAHVNTCVWNKGAGGMGGLYRSAHEFVLVFVNGATVATNNIALGKHGRDRCNVWNYPGANRRGSSAAKALALHATPKPVALVEDAFCDVTHRGDTVLDPFLGSGTSLIAAHMTGRVGRFIELDPKFVDVAVRRFTDLTGITARHAETGESFEDIARARAARA